MKSYLASLQPLTIFAFSAVYATLTMLEETRTSLVNGVVVVFSWAIHLVRKDGESMISILASSSFLVMWYFLKMQFSYVASSDSPSDGLLGRRDDVLIDDDVPVDVRESDSSAEVQGSEIVDQQVTSVEPEVEPVVEPIETVQSEALRKG